MSPLLAKSQIHSEVYEWEHPLAKD